MMTQEMATIANTYIALLVVWYITHTLGMRKMFKKAKVENKALAFIPFWREVKLFELVWDKKNMAVLWVASFILGHGLLWYGSASEVQPMAWIGFVLILVALWLWLRKCHFEARAYNRHNGTAVGLMLFNDIFTLYVGYAKTEYKGAKH